jgi:glycosyl transferase family 25
MFFDSFQAIYVINLRRRSDRRAEMTEQFRRIGLSGDPRIKFVDAAEPSDRGSFSLPGAHGCYLSHLQIYEQEAKSGRSVLVLEDDCDFRAGASEYALPTEWDIFYGGFTAADPSDLQNSNIIGSHCMGYSPRAVELAAVYLRSLLDPQFPPDARAAAEPTFDPQIRPPLDGALVWFRRAHPELRTVFADISRQRPSRSDIGPQGWLDRHAPQAASLLRKAKQWLR